MNSIISHLLLQITTQTPPSTAAENNKNLLLDTFSNFSDADAANNHEWKFKLASSISMLTINVVIGVLLITILVKESRTVYGKFTTKLGSMSRSFCVLFSVFALLFSLFDSLSHICNIWAAHEERRNGGGGGGGGGEKDPSNIIQYLTGFTVFNSTVTHCCLVCFSILLFYSSVWKAYLVDIPLIPGISLYEKRVVGLFGVKGLCILCAMVACPLLVVFDVTDASIITFVGRREIAVELMSDIVLLVFVLLFSFCTVIVCARVIHVTKNNLKFRNSVVYARSDLGETEYEVVIRAKRAAIIYMILSFLLMARMVCFLIGELVSYGYWVKSKAVSRMVAQTCVEVFHWLFIISFVIMYATPLNRTERKALSKSEVKQPEALPTENYA